MQYRMVPKNGDRLSALGFGCMRLPQQGRNIDKERAKKQIYLATEKGVNYIDTAYPYHAGQSEPFLGEILTPTIRNKIKLATKLPPSSVNSKSDMQRILDNQLKRLNTDHIDYYLLHAMEKNSWGKLLTFDIFEFLDKQIKDGKIINAGFSFHGTNDLFHQIVDAYPWTFCQIQYNILDEHFQAGTEGLKYAASKDLAVMIMEPLRGGILVKNVPNEIMKVWNSSEINRTPAQWALKWLYNQNEITVVLSGMNEEYQVEDNIKTASESFPGCLTDKEIDTIKAVRDKYKELLEIPCTACRYCMPCPNGVDIPGCFDLYNRVTFYKDNKFNNHFTYMLHNNGLEKGKTNYASNCKNCGKCVKACPQHIDIPANLKKVEKEFEGLSIKGLEIIGRLFYRRAK